MPESLESRYRAILERISAAARSAGRDPASVTLVAVSKKQPVDAIESLYRLGHRDFGENYVQELVEKARTLAERGCDGIRWHLIGHLQTNKAKQVVPWISCVQSVDSERLARELASRWAQSGRTGRLPIFLEVNISREESKSGLVSTEVAGVVGVVGTLKELELSGLMCVPAADASPEELRARFAELRELASSTGAGANLSMGMSGDFELAIAEGATHVRVGTAIFGARNT